MGGSVGWWSGNANLGHHIVLLDLLHRVEAFGDLTKNGVDAIEVAGISLAQHHEELAAAGVLTGMRHREGADLVSVRVALGLALDCPARTAGSDPPIARRKNGGNGLPALPDKVVDDAVDFHPIVDPRVRELLEVGDGTWSFLVEEIRLDG